VETIYIFFFEKPLDKLYAEYMFCFEYNLNV